MTHTHTEAPSRAWSLAATPSAYRITEDALLKAINPYGEWVNPHASPEVLRALCALEPEDRTWAASVGYFRAARPDQARIAQTQFWASPLAYAHLINALLLRGSRPITAVEGEMNVPLGKSYQWLRSGGIAFRSRVGQHAVAQLLDETKRDAQVVWVDPENPLRVRVTFPRTPGEHPAVWSPNSQHYRCTAPVPISGYWRVAEIAGLVGMSVETVQAIGALVGMPIRAGKVPLALGLHLGYGMAA